MIQPDGEPDAVVDDLGATVPVTGTPHRLVSLVPNLSELLVRWGLLDRVVGVTEYCVEPRGAFDQVPRLRGTKNPDVRAIVALEPDLVLASEEENRRIDVERLRDAGLSVHVTRVRTLAQLATSLARLARVLDVQDVAADLLQQLRELPHASDDAGPRLACAVWRDDPAGGGDDEGWWLLGRDTYGASVVQAAGGQLVPGDPGGRYPRATLAELRSLDPALVLLPDEPYAFGAPDVADLARVGLTGVPVDGRLLWWWGTRTPDAVRTLARQLRSPGPRQ